MNYILFTAAFAFWMASYFLDGGAINQTQFITALLFATAWGIAITVAWDIISWLCGWDSQDDDYL